MCGHDPWTGSPSWTSSRSQLAWLKLTRPLGLVENTALIATPNAFVKEHLETRLRPLVIHALSKELGRPIQIAVTVDPSPAAA